jgi:NAD+ kinase
MAFIDIHIVPKLNATDDPKVLGAISVIENLANQLGVPVVPEQSVNSGTLCIAVGGDGTMIEAMRRAARSRGWALGINLGHIGFLTDYTATSQLHEQLRYVIFNLDEMHQSDFMSFERRAVLENSLVDRLAINDVSISSLASDEMIKYQLLIDDHNAGIHRANSLLVSTATGSTAYSLSAGGALLMPGMQSIQVVPVAAATMTSRPLIVSSRSKVTVRVFGQGVSVRVDGQRVFSSEQSYTKDAPFEVVVNRYSQDVAVIHPKGWNFFDMLSMKLGWIKE